MSQFRSTRPAPAGFGWFQPIWADQLDGGPSGTGHAWAPAPIAVAVARDPAQGRRSWLRLLGAPRPGTRSSASCAGNEAGRRSASSTRAWLNARTPSAPSSSDRALAPEHGRRKAPTGAVLSRHPGQSQPGQPHMEDHRHAGNDRRHRPHRGDLATDCRAARLRRCCCAHDRRGHHTRTRTTAEAQDPTRPTSPSS